MHDVALTVGRGPRLHHLGFAVAEPLGVLRACDQLAAAGQAGVIERGPGRHGVSNAFFVYCAIRTATASSSTPATTTPATLITRRCAGRSSDPTCRSFWGTRAPDSWYDESSPVLGPDDEPATVVEATVDERTSRSEIMA